MRTIISGLGGRGRGSYISDMHISFHDDLIEQVSLVRLQSMFVLPSYVLSQNKLLGPPGLVCGLSLLTSLRLKR